ncbi:MAG: DinB family protein [Candidatus Kapaibacterium sp.]|jgi:hypothetical protein
MIEANSEVLISPSTNLSTANTQNVGGFMIAEGLDSSNFLVKNSLLAPSTDAKEVEDLIKLYSSLVIKVDRLRASLLTHDTTARMGGWSINEMLGHLIDSDAFIWGPRIDRIIREENPTFEAIDEDVLIREHRWQEAPIGEIIAKMMRVRWNTAVMLSALPKEYFDRVGVHPTLGELKVRSIVRMLVDHDTHHIAEIAKLLDLTHVEALAETQSDSLAN